MDEQAALDWLYRFTDWERGIGWGSRVSPDLSWNLGRTRWLLDALGAPDRSLPIVIIAGTKGKGSTAAMIECIARGAGARTVLYTQPHLQWYRERIRLDGEPIGPDAFATLVARMQAPVARLQRECPLAGEPTTYEITTALALLAGAEHGAMLGVIEVGLGGRLDATNCLDPSVSTLTRISYDHTQILGRTLGAIAQEKVAIARAGRPLVSAPQRPAARRAIISSAREMGAHIRFAEPLTSRDGSGTLVSGEYLNERFEATLALLGAHQRENAGVAVAVSEALVRGGLADIGVQALRTGLAEVRWPGRLETVAEAPLIVLDGAHNGESAMRLVAALREHFTFERLIMVVGILGDKDARSMVRTLASAADITIATRSASPRALAPADLERLAHSHGGDVVSASSVESALALARSRATPGDLICVTGSLTVVGEARGLLVAG